MENLREINCKEIFRKANENEEQILAFRARLLYQKLLDKGFRLVE